MASQFLQHHERVLPGIDTLPCRAGRHGLPAIQSSLPTPHNCQK
ncbi:hypothetical protein UCMB321_3233 [Pseudomonas batumici]|uniref:Uncharacterized protein n=1 Tax=Pseudomonas batumici TaxID=226910 RepID=A0A0C2EWD3_9PSED|nr:hypothetical protein UCMB321_3233 [Pseudomonas batumici]